MSLPTTILVSETEMRSGFAKVVSAEKLQKDSASYSFLYTLAGKEVGTGEIIGAITRAGELLSRGSGISISEVIDVMVGEQGKEIGSTASSIMFRLIWLQEHCRPEIKPTVPKPTRRGRTIVRNRKGNK
ncbi:MAG: hypothetical protein UR50_C0002G0012 [Parcubacteria group bacterium GW2011_GWC1_34_10]|uniref:Uncharacterized protein n=1 Tax=Candidatus Zambryskibacteria bacterium RIFCSPLOWO2_01_FULL_35_19 TaxID=1802757 RepID=A0A1G2TXG5_9BACT|nr:MAG: hypothetical protein UR50_C0002G0012 [Parcubacteria group bacterium GW2011_GWC1_34_10]OHA87621.1 MAG: hypothetical protein A2726_01895 [Candidatus Zambryskibacteria bacterium RIFCSPHIGHO2_01_FULL_35_32]OHB01252.1 MAG: hypothetical protein A3A90_00175 [Candidatus Zambryskibacteria bacterium RIFCSPLOWO2_01_FULL_35_19]